MLANISSTKVMIVLGLVFMVVVGGFYFLDNSNEDIKKETTQDSEGEKIGLYYDLDDPKKIYTRDENDYDKFVEVKYG